MVFDKAFSALLAVELACDIEGREFDIWVAAERVARRYAVSEQDLIDAYDEHCVRWRAEKRLERVIEDDAWDVY